MNGKAEIERVRSFAGLLNNERTAYREPIVGGRGLH
jgi:hypothetical protein